ncbi:MAG TPA: response regulator transcription factor [Solirubrobacteraceae bacterium]|nr:response regulator transcription factor [Solirubrobacteraceae bacterium]
MTTTVLIVDDHRTFRETARLLLESEGFDVVGEAEDGESAVVKAAELTPDLVLLDVQLPDIDGFEVARRVSQGGRVPAVIIVSSRDDSDFGPLVSGSGARGFVTKAELSGDRVRALLDRDPGNP